MTGSGATALIAGLDPGRSKCGLVLADLGRQRILEAAILAPDTSRTLLEAWQERGLAQVVLGNGTGSGSWRPVLAALGLDPTLVDEHSSTLAARGRYWELFPARGWRQLLPAGLRLPPRDIDDVVAQLLVERHCGQLLQRSTAAVQRNGTVKIAPAP